mgnify:CR=1 FL=1
MTQERFGILYPIAKGNSVVLAYYKYTHRVITNKPNKGEINMAFQVSRGVFVNEKYLTNIIPAVSTSSAGIVIAAEKGPVDEITTISSEKGLVDNFGKPDSNNF